MSAFWPEFRIRTSSEIASHSAMIESRISAIEAITRSNVRCTANSAASARLRASSIFRTPFSWSLWVSVTHAARAAVNALPTFVPLRPATRRTACLRIAPMSGVAGVAGVSIAGVSVLVSVTTWAFDLDIVSPCHPNGGLTWLPATTCVRPHGRIAGARLAATRGVAKGVPRRGKVVSLELTRSYGLVSTYCLPASLAGKNPTSGGKSLISPVSARVYRFWQARFR